MKVRDLRSQYALRHLNTLKPQDCDKLKFSEGFAFPSFCASAFTPVADSEYGGKTGSERSRKTYSYKFRDIYPDTYCIDRTICVVNAAHTDKASPRL